MSTRTTPVPLGNRLGSRLGDALSTVRDAKARLLAVTAEQVATAATWVSLAVIVGFGGWLRFYDISRKSLLGDEIITANRALEYALSNTLPYGMSHRFIVYTYTHYFMKWFGQTEFSLRLGAAILGTLGLVGIFLLARALFDRLTAIVATFLLSITVFHIDHSQIARFYPGLALFSMLAIFALVRALETNRKRYWALFVLATTLNLYNHLFAFLVLGTCAIWGIAVLVIRFLRAGNWKQRQASIARFAWLVIAGIAIIVCYLPAIANLADTLQGVGDVAVGGADAGQTQEEPGAAQRRLGGNTGVYDEFDFAFEFDRLLVQFGVDTGATRAFHASLFLVGVVFLIVRRHWHALSIFALAAVLTYLFLTLVVTHHFFLPKYVIYLLPMYLMTVAYGAVQAGRLVASTISDVVSARAIVAPIAAFAVTMAIVGSIVVVNWTDLPDYYMFKRSRDPRGAAAFIHHQQKPDDGIAVLWGTQFGPYNFYHTKVRGGDIGEDFDDIVVVRTVEGLERVTERHDRVWIVADQRALSWASPELYRWVLQDSFMIPFHNYPIYLKQENLSALTLDDRISLLEDARRFAEGSYNNNIPIELGDIYAARGEFASALAWYGEARDKRPYKTVPDTRTARLYENRGQWTNAAGMYSKLTNQHSDAPEYEISLGHALVEVGQPNEAAAAFHRAGKRAGTKVVELLALGDAAMRFGNFEQAHNMYLEATETNHESPEAWASLAVAYAQLGDNESSIDAIGRALSLPFEDANVALTLARANLLMERYDSAVQMARLAIERATIHPEEDIDDIHIQQRPTVPYAIIVGTLFLGDVEKSVGNTEAAEEHYREAAHWAPFDPVPISRLGLLYASDQDFDRALQAFRRAQELAPGSADDIEREARTLQQLDRPEEALDAFKRLLEIAPDDVSYRLAYADQLSALGNVGEAETEYRAIIDVAEADAREASFLIPSNSPSNAARQGVFARAYAGLADITRDRALEQGKSLDQALSLYQRGLEFNPDEPRIYLGRSEAYKGARRLDLALNDYEKAVALSTPSLPLLFGLGDLYEQHGRLADAEAAYRDAIELVPDSYPAHVRLGTLLLDQGDPGAADDVFRAAIEMEPERVAAYKRLGDLFLEEGYPSEALAFYRQATTLDPAHVPTLVALGDLHRDNGDLAEARSWYERALELDPDSNRVLRRLEGLG